jgi:hypothetical protein
MDETEVLEWAIFAINSCLRQRTSGLGSWNIEELTKKLEILERKLQRARSFTNPLGIEN